MSSEMKSVQELLAEKKSKRRVIYRRPRLTKSQIAAYYGLPDMTTIESSNENDDEGIEVEEESPPPEARIPETQTPKRRSRGLNETSKASLTFSKSVLAVFDKTKDGTHNGEEELSFVEETQIEDKTPETPKRRSRDLTETSKASITFSKSVLGVFDKTKTVEEEIEEDELYDEQMDAEATKGYSQGPSQSSKASITFSKSVLGVFDKTKTVEEESEEEDDDEQMDAEIAEKSNGNSQGSSETSKASITFSKSVLAVFDKTKTVEEGSEEDEHYNEQMDTETSKGYSQGPGQSSKASITFSKSILAVFDKTKTVEEESEDDDEQTDAEIVEKPKESSQGPSETSKASITFSKSVLAVFDKTKTVEEESEDDDEQTDAEIVEKPKESSQGPSETSKASITFSKSVLAVFDKTKTVEEESEEEDDDEQTVGDIADKSKKNSQGPSESSKASITFSKSVLAVFDKTKTTEEEVEENDQIEFETAETSNRRSHGPIETSKASITFSKSVLAVFHKTKTIEEESEEDVSDDEKMEVDLLETPKRRTHGPTETSKASVVFSESVLGDKTQAVEEESEEDEPMEIDVPVTPKPAAKTSISQPIHEKTTSLLPHFMQATASSSAHSRFPNVHIPSPICAKKLNPPFLPKPKVHVTPRKSIAVQRKVKDHSFNAAKLPVLNSSLFDDLPKAQSSIQRCDSDSRPNVDIPTVANVDFVNATPEDDVVVERIINDLDNPSLDNENDVQSPRRILQSGEDFVPSTTNTDFLNATLTEDTYIRNNNYDYDNDAGNFSAASAPEDFDEEPIEQENVDPIFNDSVYSIHTPGPSRLRPILRSKPSIPLHFNDTLEQSGYVDQSIANSVRSNDSIVKITAGLNKNKKKVRYELAKPKLIHPESPSIEQPNLRRSRRTRVHRLRNDLGQVPIYEYDQDGGRTLVDVAAVEIANPRAQKYLAVDAEEQNKREKELKVRRKSRKEFAKNQRELETWNY